jgi:hypothetical protein
MKEATQLTQPQRKALVDMITMSYSGEIWSRAKNKYEEIRSALEQSLVKELSEKNERVKPLIAAVHRYREEVRLAEADLENSKVDLDAAEEKLVAAGFNLDSDGDLALSHLRANSLKRTVENRLDDALGTKEQVLVIPFETARLKLLTVATTEEAEKLVEPLLNFEVKVK